MDMGQDDAGGDAGGGGAEDWFSFYCAKKYENFFNLQIELSLDNSNTKNTIAELYKNIFFGIKIEWVVSVSDSI